MMQRKEALLDIYRCVRPLLSPYRLTVSSRGVVLMRGARRQMVKSNIPVKTYRDGKEETLKLS